MVGEKRKRSFRQDIIQPSEGEDTEDSIQSSEGEDTEDSIQPSEGEDTEDIIQPSESYKDYKSIKLKNGLQVLLVSDQRISYAAASMAVKAGAVLDPPQVPGLTHFLEHMIMASSKFSKSNDFFSEHGCDANGFTEMEHSMFTMLVKSDSLQSSLKMFSQNFIALPLDSKAMESEINSIDSEFELKKQDENSRVIQLQCHTAIDGHPFKRFTCGNKKTFSHNNLDLSSLRKYAEDLFYEHYVGASMKLVVLGRERLDVLENWVSKSFCGIKQGSEKLHKLNPQGRIWEADTLYLLKAVEDTNTFEVSWMIPPKSSESYRERPEIYLEKVLSNVCKGSLFSFFKEKGWITFMCVTVGVGGLHSSTSIGRMFTIVMYLTNTGLEQKYELVTYIYQYLKLLRDNSPAPWVMKDYWRIQSIKFEYLDTDGIGINPYLFTRELAANMLDYPITHVVSADYLNQSCTSQAIDALLKYFSPKNMRIDLVSKSFPEKGFKTEPWLNFHYVEEKIPPTYKDKWNSISEVDGGFSLPARNRFMPSSSVDTDFDIDVDTDEDDDGASSVLRCLEVSPLTKLWYKWEQGLSYANFCIYMNTGRDVKNHVMAKIFTQLLDEELSQIIYQGNEAFLITSLSFSDDNKLELTVHGHKVKFQTKESNLHRYIKEIWTRLCSFRPELKCFVDIKERMAKDLDNENLALMDQANDLMAQMASEEYYLISDKLKALESITSDDLIAFIPHLRNAMFIEGICVGDFSKQEVKEMSELFQDTGDIPFLRKDLRGNERKPICGGKIRRDVKVKNELEANSLAKVCFQFGCNKKEIAMLYLFGAMMKDKIWDKLRTQESIGYEVECEVEFLFGAECFYVSVISSKYDPDHMLGRIYNSIQGFEDVMASVDVEKYKGVVFSQGGDDRWENVWNQIAEKRFVQGFYSEVSHELEDIEKEDIIRFYEEYFKQTSSNGRRLELCIWGCNTEPPPSCD